MALVRLCTKTSDDSPELLFTVRQQSLNCKESSSVRKRIDKMEIGNP